MTNGWDIEGPVKYLFDLIGASMVDEPPDPISIAKMLFRSREGFSPVSSRRLPSGAKAQLKQLRQIDIFRFPPPPRWQHYEILVNWKLPLREQMSRCAHELAEWLLREVYPYRGEDRELYCNALGAAIHATRAAFWIACGDIRWNERPLHQVLDNLARIFAAPESCMALRIGEVAGQGVALITPQRVIRRGAYPWPVDDSELRMLARARSLPEGLVAHRTPDGYRHLLLVQWPPPRESVSPDDDAETMPLGVQLI